MNESGDTFGIKEVLATSYGVFTRNFLLLFLLAFAATIPNLSIELLAPPEPPPWLTSHGHAPDVRSAAQALSPWVTLPLIAVGILLSFALSAAATTVLIADLRGTPFGPGDALTSGWHALPALLGIFIILFLLLLGFALLAGLVWAGVAIGLLGDPKTPYAAILVPIFVAPIVIVGLRLCLVVPVIVAERVGAVQSLKRSAKLTEGKLWRLFGLFAAAGLIIFAINAALFGTAAGLFGFATFFNPAAMVLRHAVMAAEVPFYWAVVAVSYYYLRVASEGGGAPAQAAAGSA